MAVRRAQPENGEKIAVVLGLDPTRIVADSVTLEPFGSSWIVRWTGVAVLDGEAASILFGHQP